MAYATNPGCKDKKLVGSISEIRQTVKLVTIQEQNNGGTKMKKRFSQRP
jgi:hypothetical protein